MNDDDRPQNSLADTLAERERERRKRARRAAVDSFRDLNQRRAEKGLPPIWPTTKPIAKAEPPPPPPEQTTMKNG